MLRRITLLLIIGLLIGSASAAPSNQGVSRVQITVDEATYTQDYGYELGVWKYLACQNLECDWVRVDQPNRNVHESHQALLNALIDKDEYAGLQEIEAFAQQEAVRLAIYPEQEYLASLDGYEQPTYADVTLTELTVRLDNGDGQVPVRYNDYSTINQYWEYYADEWKRISQRPLQGLTSYLQDVLLRLEPMSENQGYDYLKAVSDNIATGITVTGFPMGYQFTAYLKSLPLPEQPTRQTEEEPDIFSTADDGCGVRQHYVKFCYEDGRINSYNPQDEARAITDFIEYTIGDVQEGYILVVYGQDNAAKTREKKLLRLTQNQLIARNAVVVSDTLPRGYEDQDTENTAYLIPDTSLQQHTIPPTVEDKIRNAQGRIKQAVLSVRQAHTTQWQDVVYQIEKDNTRIKRYIDRIKQETGIQIHLLGSAEPWDTTNRELLEERVDNETPGDHPQACSAYLLYDSESVELYQSTRYCQLRILREDVYRDTPEEQIEQMLRSAQRNTRKPGPEQLMLVAYQLTNEGKADQGTRLAQHIITNELYTDEKAYAGARKSMRQASQQIVLAREALMNPGEADALQLLAEDVVFEAYPRMRSLGAVTALEAASQEEDCRLLGNLMGAYQSILAQTNDVRRYQAELEECTYRQLREQCRIIETGSKNDYPLLQLTFINDGLAEREFNESARAISETILRTYSFSIHADDMIFQRAPSAARLTTGQGRLQAPRINAKAVAAAGDACWADMLVVLSEEDYQPSTIGGNAYVSASACRGDINCMSIYTLRSLGHTIFGLEEQQDTIMAPLTYDPDTTSLTRALSSSQVQNVNEWFGGRS